MDKEKILKECKKLIKNEQGKLLFIKHLFNEDKIEITYLKDNVEKKKEVSLGELL